jgi:type I pantothenate kinase
MRARPQADGDDADAGQDVPMTTSAFEPFTREQWAALALPYAELRASAVEELTAGAQTVPLDEVKDVYVPLARLLTLVAASEHEAHHRIARFLGRALAPTPFIVAVAGSVAVGKSSTARVLQALLAQSVEHGSVELLPTDGFLYSNEVLEEKGLMERKGFPESYDRRHLLEVLSAIRAGEPEVSAPVYSHLTYDIVPDEVQVLRRPAIVIVEGLNVLKVDSPGGRPEQIASDFFDFSIYVDAAEEDIARWFYDRLMALRGTVLSDPRSFFAQFRTMPEREFSELAEKTWREINLVNLRENVAPTKRRAHLILEKDGAHRVDRVLLRRL